MPLTAATADPRQALLEKLLPSLLNTPWCDDTWQVLLDKLLPKLKAEGHRVLIFTQV